MFECELRYENLFESEREMFECELRYENLFESEREMFECEQKIESPQGTRMSTVFCAY